ncbi:AAA family ATPase [Nordella sp. HKS 07]|uniref:AAA family ATPase n=1 Tax=Nordella sp. HKS 07 TaxID=2712222 RepID=UPI0013E1296C|nr:AAA family ATPase [Nordella sp. HKS 07]QIG51919.1 AAA family ATPase [Nordella sp. HKS 07]
MKPRLFIITGAMAAGKSTVAQLLAESLPKSVHLRGDVFRRMIVTGRAEMGPVLSEEALSQLALRHRLAGDVARAYHDAGFTVVYQDILIGAALSQAAERLADLDPTIIVLNPGAETLARRGAGRSKPGYSDGFPPNILANALERETPRLGLWLDTSQMTAEEVVERILRS